MLVALKREKLVIDWKKMQATRAAVQVAIEDAMDRGLPEVYDRGPFARKSAAVFEHVFSAYEGDGRSAYESRA